MTIQEFIGRIVAEFGFEPTADQASALRVFAAFLADRRDGCAMVLRGSAGTGKTSLTGAMMRTMVRLGQHLQLMAPTGRAAKVLSQSSGLPAYTIHRKIYREKAYRGLDGLFNLAENRQRNTLFVVDEASMVSRGMGGDLMGASATTFGSGSLLDDLVQYVYSGAHCRLLLVGDKAQLPPVGEEEAPALSADMLQGYGLHVYECDLNEVLRQSRQSGVLYNATVIRQMVTHDETTQLPRITFHGFADIVRVPGDELIEALATSYSRVGTDDTIVVTRSNKRATVYNMGIRGTVLDREETLCRGDMLMVVRNNYYWTERQREEQMAQAMAQAAQTARQTGQPQAALSTDCRPTIDFLANGDRAVVQRVRNIRELYGFRFADVWLSFPDYDDTELQVVAVLDSLTTEAPALTREQHEALFASVMADYADIPTKAERTKALRADPYFNALQVKFAYAVTCHKAQGGQWSHVYVDQGYMTDDMLTPSYIHWLYTAFTRATDKLFLVNWPKNQCADEG